MEWPIQQELNIIVNSIRPVVDIWVGQHVLDHGTQFMYTPLYLY